MLSPGIGWQHGASRTEAPSLPSTKTTPWAWPLSSLPYRPIVSITASGRIPRSAISCASRLATMMAILRPWPMSVISSARLRLPLQRTSCCHSAAAVASPGSPEGSARPSARSAWASIFSPSASDSSASMVLR